jgi:O-antigen/teichoic acid export membrane protein
MLPRSVSYFGFQSLGIWIHKGFFALIDQAFLSGSSFLLSILLVKWFTPGALGQYALGYAVLTLISGAVSALISEPLAVYGSGRHSDSLYSYLTQLLKTCFVAGIAFSSFAHICARFVISFFPQLHAASTFEAILVYSPAILSIQILRTIYYVLLRPRSASIASFAYSTILIAGTFIFHLYGHLAPTNVFLLMGLSSLTVTVCGIIELDLVTVKQRGITQAVAIVSEHWIYGRWALATQGFVWLSSNAYYLILPYWIGMDEVGAMRALLTTIAPVVQIIAAMSPVVVPALTNQFRSDVSQFELRVKQLTWFCVTVLGTCYMLTVIWRENIIGVFASDQYSSYSNCFFLVQALPLAQALILLYGGTLRVLNRPNKIFRGYFVSGSVGLTIGIALIPSYGFVGALLGMVVSNYLNVTMQFANYRTEAMQYQPGA